MKTLALIRSKTLEARRRNGLPDGDTRISVAVSKGCYQIQFIVPVKGKPPEIAALTGWLSIDQLCERLGTIQCEALS